MAPRRRDAPERRRSRERGRRWNRRNLEAETVRFFANWIQFGIANLKIGKEELGTVGNLRGEKGRR